MIKVKRTRVNRNEQDGMSNNYNAKEMKQYQENKQYFIYFRGKDIDGNHVLSCIELFGDWNEVMETMRRRKS